MFKILALIIFSKLLISDEVFGGYVLFTPQGGNAGGGNNNITSYLLDTDENIYNTWSHTNGAASMPYLHPGDEPGWENT